MFAASEFPERIMTGLLPHDKAATSGAIEPGIAPLVDALNASGCCSTIASCEGHGYPAGLFRSGYMEQEPYVLFRAETDIARRIARTIQPDPATSRSLIYCWRLTGYFYPWTGELVWIIKPDDHRFPNKWNRDSINRDVVKMAAMVSQALDQTSS